MERVSVLLLAGLILGGGSSLVAAQPPAPPAPLTCDDTLRAARIQLQATTLSQLRERGEVAQELAALQKRIGQLEAEVASLTPKKDAPTSKETP